MTFLLSCFFFFFQAEDGIRDLYVTGVQTCALPIFDGRGGLEPAPQRDSERRLLRDHRPCLRRAAADRRPAARQSPEARRSGHHGVAARRAALWPWPSTAAGPGDPTRPGDWPGSAAAVVGTADLRTPLTRSGGPRRGRGRRPGWRGRGRR